MIRKFVYRDDLHRQVVFTPSPKSFFHDSVRRAIEILAFVQNCIGHERRVDVLVHPIGCKQERVTFFGIHCSIIDLDLRIGADRAAEITLPFTHPDAVIVRQLLERISLNPLIACVTDMENMRRARLDH